MWGLGFGVYGSATMRGGRSSAGCSTEGAAHMEVACASRAFRHIALSSSAHALGLVRPKAMFLEWSELAT